MSKKITVPRGTTDILPDQIAFWQSLEDKTRKIFNIYNYSEMRTPIFEDVSLFQRSLGQTSDVVNKQLLQLAGDKKEGFALRPEGTASIVRSYVENSTDKKESLSKLFYIGPMFRGERPQKGRLRQFHQIGAEAIGPNSANPYIDAEMIALSVHILKACGLSNFKLIINSLGDNNDKDQFSKYLREQLKDNLGKLCDDCQNRFERNVFRVLDCKNRDCKAIVSGLNMEGERLSDESRAYFNQVKACLDILKVPYTVDATLVRGLDYYTHTVFEIKDASLGSQDALGAGGRYNGLVSQLGGAQVDAIGFALGIERMLLAQNSQEESQRKTDLFIIALDESSSQKAFDLTQALRQQCYESNVNASVEMSYSQSSLKSQMRVANKKGARYVVILGEEELKNGVVTLKDMEKGEQTQEANCEEFLFKLLNNIYSKGN